MTFYFYDLETSGFNPRKARVMQFAGQRTDIELRPIGEQHNTLIKLSPDVAPDPDAILVTGITPQRTLAEGISEAEFLSLFHLEIATDSTIFVGYNNIRFDDEFMRYMHYRNFYDPYEWQWQAGRSRWDMLDVVRMTRALRPQGLSWPFDSSGQPSNRLELLTSINQLNHTSVHDALSDVNATIDLARLIRKKQPRLFEFLLSMRTKQQIAGLVKSDQPFIYSSGKYPGEYQKTTVVIRIVDHPKRQGSLVYDLRHDPTPFATMSPAQLATAWKMYPDQGELTLPIKTLQYNRCPAVAPLSVLDEASQKRLNLNMSTITENQQKLRSIKDWPTRLLSALEILDALQQDSLFSDEATVDEHLYDGFFDAKDKHTMQTARQTPPQKLMDFKGKFHDSRLNAMPLLYKARNYPESLTTAEYQAWESHRRQALLTGGDTSPLSRFFIRLEQLNETPVAPQTKYLLDELRLYGESILP